MNIKTMTLEELEKLSHLDIAYNILKYDKKTLTTVDLLKEICNVLNYGEKEFEDLIGDFYTSLNLDKRFILIDNKWDLTENHQVKIIVEDELDEELEEIDEDMDELDDDEKAEDDIVSEDAEAIEDAEEDLEDDLDQLSIIEDDELEEDI